MHSIISSSKSSAMREHIINLLSGTVRSTIPLPDPTIPAGEKLPAILPSDVRIVIEIMKRGTVPEPDNIPGDFFRAESRNLHVVLANHTAAYFQKEKIPDQWRASRTVILAKKGDRRDLRNYRPVWLLSVLNKLFTKIFLSRISRTQRIASSYTHRFPLCRVETSGTEFTWKRNVPFLSEKQAYILPNITRDNEAFFPAVHFRISGINPERHESFACVCSQFLCEDRDTYFKVLPVRSLGPMRA
ncbi:unnamed protein product [Angiostrongylus costaricensis]|uniref:Uma2 domain-containing protein n=1 Tax=Angiostrongylus costaricensis TaxID=334426 RepID=A0A0R3PHA9_ANGCS|nr:unnamed protein product [Angiostrongylus costaricensis]